MDDENNERNETPHKTPFPWRTLATNAAIVGGAHFVGRMGAGLAIQALAKSPLGAQIVRMSPAAQQRVFSSVGNAASVLSMLTLQAQHLAAQQRLQDEMNSHFTKKAGVSRRYAAALKKL